MVFPWLIAVSLSACVTPNSPPVRQQHVLISYGSGVPSLRAIAERVQEKLGPGTRLQAVSGDSARNAMLARAIEKHMPSQMVAVGLRAARWSRRFRKTQVVFCEVFNFADEHLIVPRHKGVRLIPPPAQLFDRWHALSPSLRRVLVISGPGKGGLIAEAKAAARVDGIQLVHQIVRSDKEYVFAYKRAASRYQGLWLLPDNRVLSRSAMIDVMSYSVRQGKQVAVFSPELLQLGGLISAQPVADDVAEQVVARLRAGAGRKELPGPVISDLTRSDLRINNAVARQLGLVVHSGRRG